MSAETYEQTLRRGGEAMLREGGAFFAGAGRLTTTLRRLAERLESAGICYALLGGFALAEHVLRASRRTSAY